VKQGFWRLVQVDALPIQHRTTLNSDDQIAQVKHTTHKRDLFHSFVPEPVREPLTAGHGDWLGELRQVSVVFTRLEGLDLPSTQLCTCLRELLGTLDPIVRRYGGYVSEFGADDKGVLLVAIFGLPPQGPERVAARATRAALALNHAIKDAGYTSGIGVDTGWSYCGLVGSDLWRDYVVIGDVMNTASRLMESAASGIGGAEVICSAASQEGSTTHYEYQALPDLVVKGKPEPLRVGHPIPKSRHPPDPSSEILGRKSECLQIA
jgi:class 3 adenylate cyclase